MMDRSPDHRPGTDESTGVDRDQHRRRIVLSVLAGLVALAGLAVPILVIAIGQTSSASFADTEVLAANQLGAAVLDIEVAGGSDLGGSTPQRAGEALFTATNLAPGDTVSGQLLMTNAGDLPFRYALRAVGEGDVLGRWLRFEVWAGTDRCAPGQPGPRVVADVQVGTEPVDLVELVRSDGVNVLAPGASTLWCLGATLPLETPNEAQGASYELTLVVDAEQVVAEPFVGNGS